MRCQREQHGTRPGSTAGRLLWLAGTIASALAFAALPASAATVERPAAGTLNVVVENDLFYGSDRNYTSGVRVSWLSGPDAAPAWALSAARRLPFFPERGSVRTSYALGQNLYTPRVITLPDPPTNDQPYAGWLYGSIGLMAENGHRLDQLELTLGIVGPAALGEKTQKLVHDITGSDEPRGWHTQLRNEPGVVLTYQRSWRRFVAESISGFQFDLTPHAGGALGNVFTHANAGLTLRLGHDLPLDYGPPRIQPSLPGSGFFIPHDTFGWYLFAGIEGRAVARNIFLDGNTFRDSRSVDKEAFIGDLQFGLALTWRRVRLSYTHVLRTREFKTADRHQEFGAFSVSIPF